MGYVQFRKPVDLAAASARLRAGMEENSRIIEILPAIMTVLQKWDGKRLNVRIGKEVAAAIGEKYRVSFDKGYTFYELRIRGIVSNVEFSDPYSLDLTYLEDPYFSFSEFCEKRNYWSVEVLTAKNERYAAIMENLPGMVERWNRAIEELRTVNGEAHDCPLSYAPFFDINE